MEFKAKNGTKITVGKSTKYKKVNFSPARIIALFKAGKNVSEIAQACGYPKNQGQNRTRRVLVEAGVYKKAAKKRAA